MRLLLTNDDGLHAPGIAAMRRKLVALGDVDVVAPATHQSATGHGITLGGPLMTKTATHGDLTGTAVEGSPADCVKLALGKIVGHQPDLVVSGINHGANVGINVLYSGTVAAAVEAAFLGRPSVAVSLYLHKDASNDMDQAADNALPVIETLAKTLEPTQVASVNLPALKAGERPRGVKVVRQCFGFPFADSYEERTDPDGNAYYWNTSVFSLGKTEPDTDIAALREGYVTVTPIHYDMTAHDRIAELRDVLE